MLPLRDDLPTVRPPVVTVAIIAANVAAFLWQVLGPGLELSARIGGAVPYELVTWQDLPPPDLLPPPLTALTSLFLHGSFAHIALNMWSLWIFGNNVEEVLGRARYLGFYLASGIAAAAAQTAASWFAGTPFIPMVGASGAIAGVLAAYMIRFPRQRILTLFPPFWLFYLPASIFIGGWFVLQVLGAVLGGVGGGGVAVAAHIGGFVAGWVLFRLLGGRGRRAGGSV